MPRDDDDDDDEDEDEEEEDDGPSLEIPKARFNRACPLLLCLFHPRLIGDQSMLTHVACTACLCRGAAVVGRRLRCLAADICDLRAVGALRAGRRRRAAAGS